MTDLDVVVSLEVKHGKATVQTYPSPSWTVNSRENSAITSAHGRQRKPDDERRQHDARQFRREGDRFHSEKLSELHVHCLGV